jgi:16S rRNA processing protein RimM
MVMNDENHYLVRDLAGCEVVTVEGEILGQLTDVLATGSNDVFVIKNSDKEKYIPALKSVVLSIDLSNKKITVLLPPGLKETW